MICGSLEPRANPREVAPATCTRWLRRVETLFLSRLLPLVSSQPAGAEALEWPLRALRSADQTLLKEDPWAPEYGRKVCGRVGFLAMVTPASHVSLGPCHQCYSAHLCGLWRQASLH